MRSKDYWLKLTLSYGSTCTCIYHLSTTSQDDSDPTVDLAFSGTATEEWSLIQRLSQRRHSDLRGNAEAYQLHTDNGAKAQ